MEMIRASLIALALLLLAAPARAEDPDVIAPYRFTDPAKELTPLERQQALDYRSQLQNQLRELDQDEARGRLDPLDRRRLLDSRGELGRMDGVLKPQPSGGLGISGNRTLPSLSGGIPLLAP
jgi:hypothetical protein